MGETIKLTVQDAEYAFTPLTAEERSLFEKQFADLFYPPWSLEREFITSRKSFIIDGIQAAKRALKDKAFGGFNASAGEIGITPIRPGQIGLCHDATNTVAVADNAWKWINNASGAGYNTAFDVWIQSPTSAGTAFTIHKDSFIIPLYIIEESASPKLQTIKIDVGRSDILYYDVTAARFRDARTGISLIPLPKMFWPPETDVLVKVQASEPGTLNIRLGGFTVAYATFLDATVYQPDGNTVKPVTL